MSDNFEITLHPVRLAFPDLWEPTAFKPGQPLQFSATFLIPKGSNNDMLVNQTILACAAAKWGVNATNVINSVKTSNQTFCYQDGDLKQNLDGYAGHMALSSKNKKQPTIVDIDTTMLTEKSGKPYAGCYVLAKVGIWAQQNENGKAMRASLLGVQFLKDGDSFTAGRVATSEEFQDLSVAEDDAGAASLM
ncbi:MAG: ssDNA-binding protein [Methylococcaceae bacterium]